MEFDPKWLTDPQVFQVNRLPAHASYTVRGADGAPLEQTLDGAWKFFYAQTPGASPQEFYREGYDVSGWDEIAVPGYIQLQGGGEVRYAPLCQYPISLGRPRETGASCRAGAV